MIRPGEQDEKEEMKQHEMNPLVVVVVFAYIAPLPHRPLEMLRRPTRQLSKCITNHLYISRATVWIFYHLKQSRIVAKVEETYPTSRSAAEQIPVCLPANCSSLSLWKYLNGQHL